MSERDAFGREKGEDALAAMGWSSSITPPAEPATPTDDPPRSPPRITVAAPAARAPSPPVRAATDPPPSGPAPARTAPRRRRRRGRVRRIVVPLFVLGFLALAAGGTMTTFLAGGVDQFPTAPFGAGTTAPDDGPSGTTLIRASALRAAVGKLPPGDIELLRVAPERIDAQVVVDGRLHNVQVTAGGEVTDVATSAPGSGKPVRVNPAAPGRIVRTATRRSGRGAGRVAYLVLLRIGGRSQWQLFFDDGLHYSAAAGGTRVKRVS